MRLHCHNQLHNMGGHGRLRSLLSWSASLAGWGPLRKRAKRWSPQLRQQSRLGPTPIYYRKGKYTLIQYNARCTCRTDHTLAWAVVVSLAPVPVGPGEALPGAASPNCLHAMVPCQHLLSTLPLQKRYCCQLTLLLHSVGIATWAFKRSRTSPSPPPW